MFLEFRLLPDYAESSVLMLCFLSRVDFLLPWLTVKVKTKLLLNTALLLDDKPPEGRLPVLRSHSFDYNLMPFLYRP